MAYSWQQSALDVGAGSQGIPPPCILAPPAPPPRRSPALPPPHRPPAGLSTHMDWCSRVLVVRARGHQGRRRSARSPQEQLGVIVAKPRGCRG